MKPLKITFSSYICGYTLFMIALNSVKFCTFVAHLVLQI
jgi:hypothetical protein